MKMTGYSKRVEELLSTSEHGMPSLLVQYLQYRAHLAGEQAKCKPSVHNWLVPNCCDYVQLAEGLEPDHGEPHIPDTYAKDFFRQQCAPGNM